MNGKLIVACSLMFLAGVPAMARDVSGINVPESISAGGKELKLNGAGMRKKFIIKVYVGALYLEAPATSLQAITGADMARSVHMHFVRSVDKEKILSTFKEGFENNSKDKLAQLQPGLDKLAAAVTDMKDHSELVVTYLPGKGTTVGVVGGPSVTVEGKEFGDALLRNWLGDKPADGNLKAAMLAGK